MENETLNLTSLICETINTIFFKIFSSIDHTTYTNLDHILFIHSDTFHDFKFIQIFGTDSSNGLLLLANSFIFGILLFYVLHFAFSHLVYSKIDSPYQFIFKCIIFIACMNSSLWICEKIVDFISLISDCILEIGSSINGSEISFSNLIHTINSSLYVGIETFDIFSFDGVLKMSTSLGILYILFVYSIRFITCKLLILLAPFAFLSLMNNRFDGFFKGWLQQFIALFSMQILVSLLLVLGFSLDFHAGDMLSKFTYFGIVAVIAKCHYSTKALFQFIFENCHHTLKKFI